MSSTEADWQEDYRAIQQGAYIVLADWSQVTLTGKDRHSFLHNMCTNDVRNLAVGHCCEAYCIDVKGKIVAHVLIFAEHESLTLLTVPGQATQLIDHLDYYLIREDVELSDDSNRFAWIVITGYEAAIASAKLGEVELAGAEMKMNSFVTLAGKGGLLAKVQLVWPPHYLLRVSNEQLEDSIARLGSLREVEQQSPAWQSLRIESQWPWFGVDFDRATLPQEVNRDERTIHLNKGCYLGQETVARIDALGHVNKQLTLVRCSEQEIPSPGSPLLRNEQEVGKITSSGWSPHFSAPAAIAWVRRGSHEVGCELQCGTGTAQVVEPVSFAS